MQEPSAFELTEAFIVKLFQRGALQKLLSSAKTVMAEHAHTCIVAVIHNLPAFRLLPLLLEDIKQKNPALRIRIAQYLYFILKLWYQQGPEDPLGREGPIVEEILL